MHLPRLMSLRSFGRFRLLPEHRLLWRVLAERGLDAPQLDKLGEREDGLASGLHAAFLALYFFWYSAKYSLCAR